MSSFVPTKTYEKLLSGALGAVGTWTVRATPVCLTGAITDSGLAQITDVSGDPTIVTCSSIPAAWVNGDSIVIHGVVGAGGTNGTRIITSKSGAAFTLSRLDLYDMETEDTIEVAERPIYTSGGGIINRDRLEFWGELNGCAVGSSATLASVTVSLGVFSCTPFAMTCNASSAVTGYVVWIDTGSVATSPILYVSDGSFAVHFTWLRGGTGYADVYFGEPSPCAVSTGTNIQADATLIEVLSNIPPRSAYRSYADPGGSGSAYDYADIPSSGSAFPLVTSAPVQVTITPSDGADGSVPGLFRI